MTSLWLVFYCVEVEGVPGERTALLRVSNRQVDAKERPSPLLLEAAKRIAGKDPLGGPGPVTDDIPTRDGDWFLCPGDGPGAPQNGTQQRLSPLAWPQNSHAFFALLAFYFASFEGPISRGVVLKKTRLWNRVSDVYSAFKDMFGSRKSVDWQQHVQPFDVDPNGKLVLNHNRVHVTVVPSEDAVRAWATPDSPDSNRRSAVDAERSIVQPSTAALSRSMPLNHLASIARRELMAHDSVYIVRAAVEDAVTKRVTDGESWIPIEGEAGTGKTTLLRRVLDTLSRGETSEKVVPLFVEGSWMLRDAGETPLGDWARRLALEPRAPWDLLDAVALKVREQGRQPVVLFDTLDAVLLSGQRDRAVHWLLGLEDLGVQVVSSCRPLEARMAKLPRERRAIPLHDFDDSQAREAIVAYIDAYYSNEPQARRHDLASRLRRFYLEQPAYAAICRRPVTLRMLFDAYEGRMFPEKLDRAKLFRDFWQHRVHDLPRPPRGALDASGHRDRFATELALGMARDSQPQPWLPGFEVDRILTRLGLDWTVYDALVSDGVLLQTDAHHPPSAVGFFHQSFMEYAVARAILRQPDATNREQLVQGLLTPLGGKNGSAKPWFEVLEEVALQAEGSPEAAQVLGALIASGVPGAIETAGAVWCRLPAATAASQHAAERTLSADQNARNACLLNLHDAPNDRAAGLLQRFAIPAWEHKNKAGKRDNSSRFMVLEAWARAALTHPAAVYTQVESLRVIEAAKEEHHIVDRVGTLLAAFLGIRDDWVASDLDDLYTSLKSRKSSRSRASLVEAVGTRVEVSEQARQLLDRWLVLPESDDLRGAVELRNAFAKALGNGEVDESQWSEESRIFMKHGEAGKRIMTVWRERIRRDSAAANPLRVVFAAPRTLPPSLWADAVEILLIPLLKESNRDALEWLLSACEPDRLPEQSAALNHRDVALRALAKFPLLSVDAERIVHVAGFLARPLQDLSHVELPLLGRCLIGIPDRASELLRGLWERGLLVKMLDVLPPDYMLEAATLFFDGTEPKNIGDPVRFARLIENGLQSGEGDPGQRLVSLVRPWFLGQARCAEEWPLRSVAFRVLPLLATGMRPDELDRLLRELGEDWANRKTDKEGSAMLACWLELTRGRETPRSMLDQARSSAVSFLRSSPPSFQATRRTAFVLLHAINPSPSAARSVVSDLIPILNAIDIRGNFTNDAVGTLRLVHLAAVEHPAWAWDALTSVVREAEKRQIGRSGWDSIRDVARHIVRVVLQHADARDRLCAILAELPGMFQAGIVDCAMETNDEVVFAHLQSIEAGGALHPTAGRKFSAWGRRKRMVLEQPDIRQGRV